jgi:hypothetical protein
LAAVDPSIIPIDGGESPNQELNQILNNYSIDSIAPLWPDGYSELLRRTFVFFGSFNQDSLKADLDSIDENGSLFTAVEREREAIPLSGPSDYMWQLMLNNDTIDDWLWYLEKIDAMGAWAITKGDSNVQIFHNEFLDPTHPDLRTKIKPNYDLYSGDTTKTPLIEWPANTHGTAVASLMVASTSDSGEVSLARKIHIKEKKLVVKC